MSPYGIKNETPEMTKWLENCVGSITGTNTRTGKPYKEGEKVAICKWNLKKHGMKKESTSELSMRDELWELENKIRGAIMGPVKEYAPPSGPWINDIFDDYVIVEHNGKLFKVPYTLDGEDVTVDWKTAVEVERKTVYESVSVQNKNASYGGVVR